MSNLNGLIIHEVKTYSQLKYENSSTSGALKKLKLFGKAYSIINKFTSQLPYNSENTHSREPSP